MDILFPWRKSTLQQGQGQGQQMQQNYDNGHHSLPHPQEHEQHYGAASSSSGARRNMMMQSYEIKSQRSMGSSTQNYLMDGGDESAYTGYTSQGGGNGGASMGGNSERQPRAGGGPRLRQSYNLNMDRSGTTRGATTTATDDTGYQNEMMMDGMDESKVDGLENYDDGMGIGGGGGPKFRPPLAGSLDASQRSLTSEISEGTSKFMRAGGGGGPPPQAHAPMPPIPQSQGSYQSSQQGSGGSHQGSNQGSHQISHSSRDGGGSSAYYTNQSSGMMEPNLIPVEENDVAPKRDRRSLMSSSSYNQASSYNQNMSTRSGWNQQDDVYQDEEEDLPVSPLRQLLDAINMSILPTSLRLSSLAQAVEFFDHRDRAMHDAELREGGAFVLYHKLGLVLRLSRCGEATIEEGQAKMSENAKNKGGGLGGGGGNGPTNHYLSYQQSLANSLAVQQQTEFDKEIAMICSCLEMVHRANPDAIAQTWDECGTEILPLLVHVLERPFQKIERAVWMALQEKANVPGSLERAVAMAVTRDQKLAVQKVTKVLAMYSLVPEAKSPMCECEGMLRWLTRIIDTHNYNRVKPGAPAIGGTSATAGMRKTLSASGLDAMEDDTDQDAKVKQAKRLELATRATSGSGLYMTEAARFNTIATLTNLAALENNRMPMLREPGLLDNICRAVHNERSDVPKQCSALAIMNLSNGDMDHVPEMARNDLVLETLLKLCKEDNPETRRNAVVTIFNVACSDQNTVRLARYRDGTILEALVELIGSDDPVLRTHDEARANAAETLFNMSCSEISETTDRMANHAGLLECLAVTLRGEHTGLEVKMYCSATLRRMAELIRHPMIAQGALLSALVKAATWTNTDCIAEAFRAQASVSENCIIMAHHHGLLNALSRLALTRGEGPDVEKVRMASCLAIELMSRQDEARALLSQNEGIIMALTKASYGEEQQEAEDMRLSRMSELGGSVTEGFFDASGRSGSAYRDAEEDPDSDDDQSLQSRRIQVALKNLVAAM